MPKDEDLVRSTEQVWLDSGRSSQAASGYNVYSDEIWTNLKSLSDYTFQLEQHVENVHMVRLKQYYLPVSARFYVVRASQLFANANTDFDTVHDAALAGSMDEGQSTTKAVIFNDAGTASLNVQAMFTAQINNDAGTQFRTYDIFVCTGTYNTTDTDSLKLSSPDDNDGVVIYLTGENSNDGTTTVAANVRGESSVAVFTEHQTYNLHIALNGCPLRRIVEPRYDRTGTLRPWAAYKMYWPSDVLYDTENKNYVVVLKAHFSLHRTQDVTAQKISVVTDVADLPAPSKTGSNGAFVVFQPAENSEHVMTGVESKKYEATARVSLVDSIRVWWTDQNGQSVMFPIGQTYFIDSLTTAGDNVLLNDVKSNTLLLEFETFKVKPGYRSWA